MKKLAIGIDMGHTLSGEGTGAQGCGYREEKLNRELGNKVISLLKAQGHAIIDCTIDKSSSNSNQLRERVAKANAQILDIFVSIHFNACVNDQKGDGRTTGVECIVSHKGTKAYTNAENVCKKISSLGLKNRGVKVNDNIYVTRKTNAPAFLIETCFIDDKDDMDIYLKNVDKVARMIAESIQGESIKDEVETPKNGVYRCVTGSFKSKDNALTHQKELEQKGINSFLVYTDL